MRLIITGHREEKLESYGYDANFYYTHINRLVWSLMENQGVSLAYSGMASGIDLIFCEACIIHKLPFIACVPFEGQEDYMTKDTQTKRARMLKEAKEIKKVKNSWMVENCDVAICVWDGNKGGTHNVVQQLVEKKKNFYWINPVAQVVWKCFV
jgi:uncharacterized phage-like protein YoqJ